MKNDNGKDDVINKWHEDKLEKSRNEDMMVQGIVLQKKKKKNK